MCGGGKGGDSSTQTTSQNSTATQSPPDYLNSAYQQLVGQAQQIANSPLQTYQGNTVAPFSGAQTQAFDQVQAAQGAANPYINSATSAVGASQTPLWSGVQQFSPDNIQQYENPYQTDVINSTMQQIGQLNAQQQSQLQGNAASSHALGGDRAGIAAASLANQQGLAAGQTLSQLNNQNYAQAQGEFNNQQSTQLGANEANAWLNSQAGSLYSNLGNQALNTQLTGSQALLSTGNQQQAQSQAELNYPYEVFQQQQAYPYQSSQYLANLLEGIGGVAGGTTTGSSTGTSTTSQAAPSTLSQILGGLTAGAGLLGQTGVFSSAPTATAPVNDFSDFAADFGNLGSLGQQQATANNFLGAPAPSTSGITFNRGGIIGRRRLAGGGISSAAPGLENTPDVDVSFIPLQPPTGVHANFPTLPQPAQTGQQGSSGGSGGGGGSSTLGDIGQVASIAAMFMRKGGIVPHRASGGGVFSSMSAAHRSAPKIGAFKVPDLLKTPKFDDGGSVTGMGGMIPTAQNQNPIVQSSYQRYAQMSPEKLQEMMAHIGNTPQAGQAGLAQKAMQQKRMMPSGNAGVAASAAPNNLQLPAQLMGNSGFARGGVSRETYADGGGDSSGISIPYPPPPDFVNDPDANVAIAADEAAKRAAPVASSGIAASSSPSLGSGITIPQPTHHEPLPPAQHYSVPEAEKPDPWNALTQAGFAIMAGKHPNALQNIGEGALAGTKAYAKERNDASERTYRTGELSDAVNKLNEEADFHRNNLNTEQEKLDQDSIKAQSEAQYKQADVGLRQQQLERDQWQLTADPMGGGFVKMNKKTGEVVPVGNNTSSSLDFSPTDPKTGDTLKGDDFLKTLPDNYKRYGAMMKGIATGAQPFPSTYALSKPLYANVIMPGVYAYNPNANGQMFSNIKAFETGKQGDQLKYLNTSVAHLDTAQQLADALDNKDTKVLNRVANMWKTETGEDAPTNFDTAKQIVGTEVMKAISNAGAGGVAEREELQSRFDKAGSPVQLKGAISTAQKLLVGQMGSVRKQYEYSTQQQDFLTQRLTPRTRAIYEKYDPDKDQGTTAVTPTAFPNAPAVGTAAKGYIYNGGDPSQPTSWTKQ